MELAAATRLDSHSRSLGAPSARAPDRTFFQKNLSNVLSNILSNMLSNVLSEHSRAAARRRPEREIAPFGGRPPRLNGQVLAIGKISTRRIPPDAFQIGPDPSASATGVRYFLKKMRSLALSQSRFPQSPETSLQENPWKTSTHTSIPFCKGFSSPLHHGTIHSFTPTFVNVISVARARIVLLELFSTTFRSMPAAKSPRRVCRLLKTRLTEIFPMLPSYSI